MMIRIQALIPILLGFASCSSGVGNEAEVARRGAVSPSVARVQIEATYDPSLGNNIGLTFRNGESYPICFSSNDLLPGFGTTLVRDMNGTLLSGDINQALEDFRGVNLASPITALRPGQTHHDQVNLEQVRETSLPITLQIGVRAFRCSELFDGGNRNVERVLIERAFVLRANSIAEYRGPKLGNNEEPPPSPR